MKSSNHSSYGHWRLQSVTLLLITTVSLGQGTPGTRPPTSVPGRILVKPAAGVGEELLQGIFREHGAEEADQIAAINLRILKVPEAERDRVLEALQQNPNIEFAETDQIAAPDFVPNDPSYKSQWHLPKISGPAAWDMTSGSPDVIIAILDTGVDAAHPDLAAKIVPGWNTYDNNSDTTDVNGHGTAVAGTAAALGNNGAGIASVAWSSELMPVRISDTSGTGYGSTISQGLIFAADHGARVANVSYRMDFSSSVTSAAQYFMSKGGVVSMSAGNNSTLYTNADNPYILVVSATDSTDNLASWSNTGNNVDLAAPGVSIYTTTLGGGYGSWSGTSFSAPIVAGVAALVISGNPNLSGAQVQDILKKTAHDLGPTSWDPSYGWGRVDAYNAVLAATGASSADTTPPAATITSPSVGSTVSGTVTIGVSASDNVGVAKVECYINGALAATSTSSSASFSWNTTGFANGSYTLQAKAYDGAGNVGTSGSENVSVQNAVADTAAPAVTITAPLTGSTVSGVVSVTVNATDNVGVTRVEWYLNGTLAGASASASATFSWNTTTFPNRSCALTARAYDAAGNVGTSSTTSVTVQNTADTTAPAVQITSPTDGSTVVRSTKVYVTASDNVAVTRVDLLVDGKPYATSTSPTPVFSWSTSKISRGSHTLQAVAYDAAANPGRSTVVTVSK